MLLTIIVSFVTILFTWAVAFPIGIYSATHQYSWGDYGLSLPRLPRHRDAELHAGAGADVFRQRRVRHVDRRPDGRPNTSASRGRGTRSSRCSSTAGSRSSSSAPRHRRHDPAPARQPARRAAEAVRRHRARQGPAAASRLLVKYPLRMALNFFISDIGSLLPHIISGAEIIAVVLSLPTTGPMLLERAARARTCTSPARS